MIIDCWEIFIVELQRGPDYDRYYFPDDNHLDEWNEAKRGAIDQFDGRVYANYLL